MWAAWPSDSGCHVPLDADRNSVFLVRGDKPRYDFSFRVCVWCLNVVGSDFEGTWHESKSPSYLKSLFMKTGSSQAEFELDKIPHQGRVFS